MAPNYLFSTTSQLNGKFEGQCFRRGTWYRRSGNGVGNCEGPPISSQNFMNFGPLTAKNRTVVFTHLPKSSSAWRRRPSRWPALRRANISSFLSVCLHLTNSVDVALRCSTGVRHVGKYWERNLKEKLDSVDSKCRKMGRTGFGAELAYRSWAALTNDKWLTIKPIQQQMTSPLTNMKKGKI